MRRTEELRINRPATSAADAKPQSAPSAFSRSVLLVLLSASVALPAVFALPASADSEKPLFEPFSSSIRYSQDFELRGRSLVYRNEEERSVEAPTKFRIKSMLRYTMPIGNTGMQLRVSVPLKKKKIVKIQIRF